VKVEIVFGTPFVRSKSWHLRPANAVLPNQPAGQQLLALGRRPLKLARTSDYIYGIVFALFIGTLCYLWPSTLLRSAPFDLVINGLGWLFNSTMVVEVLKILVAIAILCGVAIWLLKADKRAKAAKDQEKRLKEQGVTPFRANYATYEVQYAFEGNENRTIVDRLRSWIGFTLMAGVVLLVMPVGFALGMVLLSMAVDQVYVVTWRKTRSHRQAVHKAAIILMVCRFGLILTLLVGMCITSR